jgi:hypothetical protein
MRESPCPFRSKTASSLYARPSSSDVLHRRAGRRPPCQLAHPSDDHSAVAANRGAIQTSTTLDASGYFTLTNLVIGSYQVGVPRPQYTPRLLSDDDQLRTTCYG